MCIKFQITKPSNNDIIELDDMIIIELDYLSATTTSDSKQQLRPIFRETLKDLILEIGQKAQLKCVVDRFIRDAQPLIEWRVNGNIIIENR